MYLKNMTIILTCTRNELNNFHTLSTTGLFVPEGHCQIFASSLQLCSHDCVLSHTEQAIFGKILNVQSQVFCLLVKYERIMGTSGLVMVIKQTLMITLNCINVCRQAVGNSADLPEFYINEPFPSRGVPY